MLYDFDSNGPHNTEFYAPAKANFHAYVQSLIDEECGRNLREGWVPCTHRWIVTAVDQVIGVTRVRHRINTPFLSENVGHIGFDVAPSHRRRGYGHFALATAVTEAKRLRIARALLYTAEGNIAARAVIERAGGSLEQTIYSEFWNERLCKYWISIEKAA